jgi:hypothetical protein
MADGRDDPILTFIDGHAQIVLPITLQTHAIQRIPGQFSRRRVGGSCWGGLFATISRDESSSPRAGGCGSVGADDDLAECALAEGVQGGLCLVQREDLLDGHSCIAAGQTVADAVEHLAGRVGVYRDHGHGL